MIRSHNAVFLRNRVPMFQVEMDVSLTNAVALTSLVLGGWLGLVILLDGDTALLRLADGPFVTSWSDAQALGPAGWVLALILTLILINLATILLMLVRGMGWLFAILCLPAHACLSLLAVVVGTLAGPFLLVALFFYRRQWLWEWPYQSVRGFIVMAFKLDVRGSSGFLENLKDRLFDDR